MQVLYEMSNPVFWKKKEKTITNLLSVEFSMKICLFKYIENFTTKNWKFSDKNYDIFRNSAKNIECGYSLELPQWGSSNEYPQFMFLSRK